MLIGSVIFSQPHSYSPNKTNDGFRAYFTDSELLKLEVGKISSTAELSNSIKWLTNLSQSTCFNSQLSNTPRILNEGYLRVPVPTIINELGIADSSLHNQATTISTLFANILKRLRGEFGITDLPKGGLYLGFSALNNVSHTSKNPDINEAVSKSILQISTCERSSAKAKESFYSFVVPRLEHADHMLCGPFPSNSLEWLHSTSMPNGKDRLNWLLNCDFPFLAEIEIKSFDPSFNALLNWGSGSGNIRTNSIVTSNSREFVSSNELKFLSTVSNINVGRVAIGKYNTSLNPIKPDLSNQLNHISYAYGLIAENLWYSLLNDPVKLSYSRSFLATWLHAKDRINCLHFAKRLYDKGYSVVKFGYGRVIVSIQPSMATQLRQDATEAGLYPSLGFDRSIELSPLSNLSDDNFKDVVKQLYYFGMTENILEF